jgi:hypothetical protein
MTTALANTDPRSASPATPWVVLLGTIVAFAAPLGLGVATSDFRASLCPPDALICSGFGIWALTLTQVLPYLAFFPPLLILGVAAARSPVLAFRVLLVYGALFVLLLAPLWMLAAPSYYTMTPRGIVRQDGPLGQGRLYDWTRVVQIVADCSAGTLGDVIPIFAITLADGTVLDPAAVDGFVAQYPAIAKALAGSFFTYDNGGLSAHCPAAYRGLFGQKPGSHS